MTQKLRHIILLTLAMLTAACSSNVEEKPMKLVRCADCPVARTSGRAFVVDGTAYIWAGRSAEHAYHSDIWQYNADEDSWTLLPETPLKARVRPCVCVVGEEVYMGLGFHGQYFNDSTYLRDWWCYRPKTGEWRRLQDYPSNQTLGAIAMTDGTYIYVGFGCMQHENRDIFRYDIANNQWTPMQDDTEGRHTFPSCAQGVAAADCQGRHFVGTGVYWKSLNYWAEFIPDGEQSTWRERASVPGRGRSCATACATSDAIYLSGGRHLGGTVTNGEVFEDVLRYDVADNKWYLCATLPDGPRENMMAWTLGDNVYFGLGNDKYDKPCKEIYRIAP